AHEVTDRCPEVFSQGVRVHVNEVLIPAHGQKIQHGCTLQMYRLAVYLCGGGSMTYDPYALVFPAAALAVAAEAFAHGGPLPASALAASGNESPALTWGLVPDGTKSLVVTAYDADAPIPGGLWHWIVKDIPATVRGLAAGALPPGATVLPNDLGAS